MARNRTSEEIVSNSTREAGAEMPIDLTREYLLETNIMPCEDASKQYLDDLAFMEDILTIYIPNSSDRNAENPVPVGVNGVHFAIPRDREIKLRRKVVNALLGSAMMDIETRQYIDNNGAKQTAFFAHHGVRYPIEIRHDPAGPKGRAWQERAIRNGGT